MDSNQNIITDFPFLLVRDDKCWRQILCKDILFFEAAGKYTKIILAGPGRKYLTRSSLTSIVRELPEYYFCRVHRAYVVGLLHVNYIGDDIVNIGLTDIPISKVYEKQLYKRFIWLV